MRWLQKNQATASGTVRGLLIIDDRFFRHFSRSKPLFNHQSRSLSNKGHDLQTLALLKTNRATHGPWNGPTHIITQHPSREIYPLFPRWHYAPGGECWRSCWRSCCYFSSVQMLEVACTHSPFNVRHGPNGFKDLQMLTANPCLSEHSRSTIRRSSTLA